METDTPELDKGTHVREMFDGIAPRYDFLNRMLSLGIDRRWRKRLVGEVSAASPVSILDIATGTGDVAIKIARELPCTKITGADVSAGMLKIADTKIAAKGLSERISTVQAPAESLPFPETSFDAVTVAFGVRNYNDLRAGLSEAARVLRPGGSMHVLEFAMPEGKFFGPLYRFYFRRVLPVIGGWVSGNRGAYTYLPDSVGDFPYGERFLELMGQAGFSELSMRSMTGGVAYIYTGKK